MSLMPLVYREALFSRNEYACEPYAPPPTPSQQILEQIALNRTNICIEGDPEFCHAVLENLKKLCSVEIGCELIQRVVQTSRKVLIQFGHNIYFAITPSNECTVYWNPTDLPVVFPVKEAGEIHFKEIFISSSSIAHELIHFLHFLEEGPPVFYQNPPIALCRGFPNVEERYTVTGEKEDGHYNPINESMIHQAFGEPSREFYFSSRFPPGNDSTERNAINYTRLMDAAGCGALENVKDLIRRKADLDARDGDGESALIHAVKTGMLDCTECLLNNRAGVNVVSSIGPPLFYAAEHQDFTMVELLLRHNASVDLAPYPTLSGETPLQIAVKIDHLPMVKLLHQEGANIHATSAFGMNVLHLVKSPELARSFIEARVNLNAQDNQGATPLHRAAERGDDELVKLFCEYEALISL